MKKRLVFLALAAFVILTACADPDSSDPNDPFGDMIGLSSSSDAQPDTALRSFSLPYFKNRTLDPITCPDGIHQTLGALLYDGLFTLDETLTLRPALATGYSYDAANREYTIALRSGITFSDGSPVSASDVVATLRRAQISERYAARLAEMVSVSGSGNTVYITLSTDCAGFASRLDIPIVKTGTEDQMIPVGTGLYCCAEDDKGLYLTPNLHRWRQGTLPIARIALKDCKDEESLPYAFNAQQIQLLACDLTGTTSASFSGSGEYIDAATTVMQYIGCNTGTGIFSDAALRAAVSAGIDRVGCVNAYLLGHGHAAQFPLSPVCALYPVSMEQTYSPDNYLAALEAAGYNTGVLRTATLLVNEENPFRVHAARKIAADLSQYDIQISVSALPWEEYRTALTAGRYDLYYGECRLSADWDLTALLGEGGALNFSAYADEELTRLITEDRAANPDRRGDTMRALCARLQTQSPFVPISFKNISMLLPSGALDGVIPTAANPFFNLPDWTVHWANAEE
ncbi:MAG: ABC transporter substrate-binding protein [Oscillospiraceae bacterium]|nr:ABC transporter substrate-binding protein [Oscillospiraceae bacterium]